MAEKKESAVAAVRTIRRVTRKKYSAEEKVRIVLEGLRGETSIAGRLPDELVLAADARVVGIYGIPNQIIPAHVQLRTNYVDSFGFVYFDQEGAIQGLYTNVTHMLYYGHPWRSSGSPSHP